MLHVTTKRQMRKFARCCRVMPSLFLDPVVNLCLWLVPWHGRGGLMPAWPRWYEIIEGINKHLIINFWVCLNCVCPFGRTKKYAKRFNITSSLITLCHIQSKIYYHMFKAGVLCVCVCVCVCVWISSLVDCKVYSCPVCVFTSLLPPLVFSARTYRLTSPVQCWLGQHVDVRSVFTVSCLYS